MIKRCILPIRMNKDFSMFSLTNWKTSLFYFSGEIKLCHAEVSLQMLKGKTFKK